MYKEMLWKCSKSKESKDTGQLNSIPDLRLDPILAEANKKSYQQRPVATTGIWNILHKKYGK